MIARVVSIACHNIEDGDTLADLEIGSHLQENLRWCVELWDRWIPRNELAMGGGSILEARWHHRFSTDIDLFLDIAKFRELDEKIRAEISLHLRNLLGAGAISGLEFHNDGYLFETPHGNASLFGTYRLTKCPISLDVESTTGLHTESTGEILFRKLRGRMVNGTRYVARDLYDVVSAYVLDSNALETAFDTLEAQELECLVYDVDSGASQVFDIDRILDPRYPQLIESLNNFNSIAGAVLSRRVPTLMTELLNNIFGDNDRIES